MENQWIGFVTAMVATVASHAMLHRDLAAVGERLAKLEGTVEGFIAGFWARPRGQGQQPS